MFSLQQQSRHTSSHTHILSFKRTLNMLEVCYMVVCFNDHQHYLLYILDGYNAFNDMRWL